VAHILESSSERVEPALTVKRPPTPFADAEVQNAAAATPRTPASNAEVWFEASAPRSTQGACCVPRRK